MVKSKDVKTEEKSEAIDGEIVERNPPAYTKAIAKRTPATRKAKKKGELVQRDSAMSIVGSVTTKDLKAALEIQTEQRKLIEDFIKKHLREGTDFGKIHVVKNCAAEDRQRGSCDKSYHYSKSILFKPGQEKIFSLFSITDDIVKDEDAYIMLPDVKGLVAYKCIMYQKGNKIGEGRGAATLSSERSDPNSTIKKAEKRARMDACLSLGFSEYFTQDLDDPEYAAQREMANSKAAAEADRIDKDEFGLLPRDPDQPIDNKERAVLHRILLAAGFSDYDEIKNLLSVNGIEDPTIMTSGQAREMMGKVSHGMFQALDPKPVAPVEPELPRPPAEPEIEVDDLFREEVANRVRDLGLNDRGIMWLLRRAVGKPFAKWETMSDENFRVIYDVITAIENGQIEVEEHNIKQDSEPVNDSAENVKIDANEQESSQDSINEKAGATES